MFLISRPDGSKAVVDEEFAVVPVVVGDVVLDGEDVVVVVNGSSEGPVTNHDEVTENKIF